jgi:Tol biopolymer transport system component
MADVVGTRIGAFEFTARLGAGGMGDVYRARDARLNRDVAIKLLPPGLADADRIARFEREAQILAALNHPHIAQVFGVVDLPGLPHGSSTGIVMELVEGGTLADRILNGPLPPGDALRIARDVAAGLQTAHDSGIIHRDLKPANIALTSSGRAKILDFGLGKVFAPPTHDSTVLQVTTTGTILGTAPYMSPEQARGLPLDRRTDVWSFGCVLYEMLTGSRPFAGASPPDVVAAILEREPDLERLPPATPPRIRWLVRRCLEKDPERRLHDIADARIELDEAIAPRDQGERSSAPAPATRQAWFGERLAWIGVSAALAGVALWLAVRPSAPGAAGGPVRLEMALSDRIRLTSTDPASRFAVSPDGRRIVFVASDGGPSMLWVRSLDALDPRPIPGTEAAMHPFWSPDSASIAFVVRRSEGLAAAVALRRVDLDGGAPVTLAEGAFSATGAWGPDGVILFTPTGNAPLHRISATSPGAPVPVGALDTARGEVQHSFPSFLPDGRHFVYTALGSPNAANEARGIYLGSLDGEAPRLLAEDASHGVYASGHLLFLRHAALIAQPFDVDARALRGEPVRIADGVQMATRESGGTGAFSVSQSGVLLYQTGIGVRSQLAWVDRKGQTTGRLGEPADYADVAISPDGSRVLVSALDPLTATRDLWMFETARGVRDRVTSEPSDDYAPVWSPGGDRIVFTSVRDGSIDLYERRLDGSGERKLDSGGSPLGKFAAHLSPDGAHLLFIAGGRALARSDIHVVSMRGAGPAQPVLESPFIETQIRFSPGDGRHVAYVSNESDQLQVYVDAFPARGEKQRVSIDGGMYPRWSADGRELFFLGLDGTLMAAAISRANGRLTFDTPRPLFHVRLRPTGRLDAYPYDVMPDGQRFLFNTFVEEATSTGLTLVMGWER